MESIYNRHSKAKSNAKDISQNITDFKDEAKGKFMHCTNNLYMDKISLGKKILEKLKYKWEQRLGMIEEGRLEGIMKKREEELN